MNTSLNFDPLGIFGGIANLFSGIANNDANERINERNIELAREINTQQMQLQRETNAQNMNMPMAQYSQLRGLGASRASALGALGAPQSAGTATLNVPQATNAMQAPQANLSGTSMIQRMSDAQLDNIKADTNAKNEDINIKREDVISKRLDNIKSRLSNDAYDSVNKVVNDYLAKLDKEEIPSYNNFLQNITEEERKVIDKSGLHTELAQSLIQQAQVQRGNVTDISLADIDNMIAEIDSSYYGTERNQEFISNMMSFTQDQWEHFSLGIQHAIEVANEDKIKQIADNLYTIQKGVSDNKRETWQIALKSILGDNWGSDFLRAGTQLAARRIVGRAKFSIIRHSYNFNQQVK